MKNRILLIAGLAILAGLAYLATPSSVRALPGDGPGFSKSPQNDVFSINGFGNQASSYTVRITSSGDIFPGDIDRGGDLGDPTHKWRALYVSTSQVDDQRITGTGANISTQTATRSGISRNTWFNIEPGVYPASGAVTLTPNGSFASIASTGGPSILMTATPNIATATAKNGDFLFVYNSSIPNVTFQDQRTQANSGLALYGNTITLTQWSTLGLVFNSTAGLWAQVYFSSSVFH